MRKLFAAVSLAIALILGAAVPTSAQGEGAIHGTVTAQRTDQPFPGQLLNSRAPLCLRR